MEPNNSVRSIYFTVNREFYNFTVLTECRNRCRIPDLNPKDIEYIILKDRLGYRNNVGPC